VPGPFPFAAFSKKALGTRLTVLVLFRSQMFHIGLQTRDIVTFENYQPSTKQNKTRRVQFQINRFKADNICQQLTNLMAYLL
jgi:hypothetical protein